MSLFASTKPTGPGHDRTPWAVMCNGVVAFRGPYPAAMRVDWGDGETLEYRPRHDHETRTNVSPPNPFLVQFRKHAAKHRATGRMTDVEFIDHCFESHLGDDLTAQEAGYIGALAAEAANHYVRVLTRLRANLPAETPTPPVNYRWPGTPWWEGPILDPDILAAEPAGAVAIDDVGIIRQRRYSDHTMGAGWTAHGLSPLTSKELTRNGTTPVWILRLHEKG